MISDKLKQVILQTLDLDDFDLTDETVALREVLTARGQWHPRPDA